MLLLSKIVSTVSKVISTLLLVFLFTYSLAQDNNVWVVDGMGIGFKMDFNTEPPSLTTLTDINWKRSDRNLLHFDNVTVNSRDGSLKYYTRHNRRLTVPDHIIEVYDSQDNVLFTTSGIHDSINYYGSSYIYEHQDTLSILAQIRYGVSRDESRILKIDYEISSASIVASYWIEGYSYKQTYLGIRRMSFLQHKGDVYALYEKSDSLKIGRFSHRRLINQFEYKWSYALDQGESSGGPMGQRINSDFSQIDILFSDDEIVNNTGLYYNRNYSTLDFDFINGFSNKKGVYFNRDITIKLNGTSRASEVFTDVAAASDRRYTYMLYSVSSSLESYLIKFKDGMEIDRLRLNSWFNRLRLGPNGKIYVFPYAISKDQGQKGYVGVIENPGEDGVIVFNEPPEYYLNPISQSIIKAFTLSLVPTYDKPHKKVKFEADTLCSGLYAGFRNLTDSTHFERYRFYFGDGDSAEIDDDNNLLLSGIDNIANEAAWGVKHRYTAPGTYLVKLRAYNAAGGWVWYSHEVAVVESSIPKFSVADTIGCEWIAYQIQDLSKVVNKGRDIIYHWTFGDGTDSTITFPLGEGWDGATNTKQYKTYSQSGDYKIQLTIDDGYCIDSFSLNNNVEILEAPRPGITAAPVEGCSPVRVAVNTTYSDVRDSVIYTWGDGVKSTSILGESSHTYLLAAGVFTSQYLTIYQSIHGPTGCVTTDSQTVIVHPGFLSADTPYLSLVTVNPNQQIEITWDSFPGATDYQLFRNGAWLADAATSNYTDATTKESLHEIATYTIFGTNVCEEKTLQSNIGQNIVLTGKGSDDNTISFLEWTPYQKWRNEVVDYAIAVQNDDNSFTEIYRENANGTKKYTDETFLASALSGFATYKCYRIAAYELDYPQQISYSNVECVPFKPVIFIPTAFTPNGDNLNDVYRPVTFGIEFYEVKVYNRYGQLIADFDQNSKGWNAADAPTGAYMVTIRAKGTDNLWYNEKSTVTVVR